MDFQKNDLFLRLFLTFYQKRKKEKPVLEGGAIAGENQN
jgi:hypothetical protein